MGVTEGREAYLVPSECLLPLGCVILCCSHSSFHNHSLFLGVWGGVAPGFNCPRLLGVLLRITVEKLAFFLGRTGCTSLMVLGISWFSER